MKFNSFLAGLCALGISVINLPAQLVGFSQYATGGTAVNVGTNWAVIPAELASQMQNSEGISVSPIPVVTFLDLVGFSVGTPTLQSYYSTNSTYITASGLTAGTYSTNFVSWPNGTNGFAPGQWVVLHHVAYTNSVSITNVIYGQTNVSTGRIVTTPPDQVADEALQIAVMNGVLYYATNTTVSGLTTNTVISTNLPIAFNTTPLQTVNPNDQLFQETTGASIPLPSANTTTSITGPGILSGQRRKPLLLTIQSGSSAGTNSIPAVNATFVP